MSNVSRGLRRTRAQISALPHAHTGLRTEAGLTLLEILIALAVLGIILGIGIFNARQTLTGSQERAAIQTVRQSIWQGATAASARGRPITLTRNGRILRLMDGETVIRTDELPPSVGTNFPEGMLLEFSPPGKITPESLGAFMERDPWIGADGRTHHIEVSVIGEVRALGGG